MLRVGLGQRTLLLSAVSAFLALHRACISCIGSHLKTISSAKSVRKHHGSSVHTVIERATSQRIILLLVVRSPPALHRAGMLCVERPFQSCRISIHATIWIITTRSDSVSSPEMRAMVLHRAVEIVVEQHDIGGCINRPDSTSHSRRCRIPRCARTGHEPVLLGEGSGINNVTQEDSSRNLV